MKNDRGFSYGFQPRLELGLVRTTRSGCLPSELQLAHQRFAVRWHSLVRLLRLLLRSMLTINMVPLLRQAHNGERLKVMIAITRKGVAVLVPKRTVPPVPHKLLLQHRALAPGSSQPSKSASGGSAPTFSCRRSLPLQGTADGSAPEGAGAVRVRPGSTWFNETRIARISA